MIIVHLGYQAHVTSGQYFRWIVKENNFVSEHELNSAGCDLGSVSRFWENVTETSSPVKREEFRQ